MPIVPPKGVASSLRLTPDAISVGVVLSADPSAARNPPGPHFRIGRNSLMVDPVRALEGTGEPASLGVPSFVGRPNQEDPLTSFRTAAWESPRPIASRICVTSPMKLKISAKDSTQAGDRSSGLTSRTPQREAKVKAHTRRSRGADPRGKEVTLGSLPLGASEVKASFMPTSMKARPLSRRKEPWVHP
jgi:hypothetical protein